MSETTIKVTVSHRFWLGARSAVRSASVEWQGSLECRAADRSMVGAMVSTLLAEVVPRPRITSAAPLSDNRSAGTPT